MNMLAVRACFLFQWDEDDLLELLSIMCNQNAAGGECGNMTKPALILIFVVVSSDKDFATIVVGQAWWHGKGAYCLWTKYRFPCKILVKLILVPPDMQVYNFQPFSIFTVLMHFFFVTFMYARLNNSFANHSRCLDFSHGFQIRLEGFFSLLKLMLEKCSHSV